LNPLSEQQEVKMNLYQKISAVMKDVDYLQKDDQISFNKTNYKAISEEKVTSTVRQALIKYGLVILPIEQEHSREGNLSIVNTKYKIVDTETGQFETIVSSGTGADTQDKGVGKAMTYSYKYMLLRTFAIPTGEDPDKVSSAELDSKQKTEQIGKPVLLSKWKMLGGTEEQFEPWYEGQRQKYNHNQIDVYLTKKMQAKNKGA
jgi:hypothetical protein